MAKENDRAAREKELARQYEKKMAARERQIRSAVNQRLEKLKPNPYELHGIGSLLNKMYIPAFSEGKYQKPSEFFLTEMPWIFGLVVYNRFKDAFLYMADHVLDYSYCTGWFRTAYRSEQYLQYADRLAMMLHNYSSDSCVDADLCDILTGNLPEDAGAFLHTRNTLHPGFIPELLAYELDQENPKLESIVTDIVNGDSDCSKVTRDLIRGIIMSHNPRMHQLLCRLLLAARLQEGLRQAICEEADAGTVEAFQAILSTILEHDLLRYSSVKRAVGTWIGVIAENTRDLDRINRKSVELICRCMSDVPFREECIASEDSMAIHIALWAYACESIQKGFQMLDRINREGTHHQLLTAGYFVGTLGSDILRHAVARSVLKDHRERNDIIAVYLSQFLQFSRNIASKLAHTDSYPDIKYYFDSREEALEFSDWLFERFLSMQGKELEFNPCIFPWHMVSLKKSELIEKSMILAVSMKDAERIDRLCPYIADCDPNSRALYFTMMTKGDKTPVVRTIIIDCLQDKSYDTRSAAMKRARELELTQEEHARIEDMLRLRYDDLRRNAIELLMTQDDDALEQTLRRLLGSSKTQMRTAGLDIVTQLSKSDDRCGLAQSCMVAVRSIDKPTTQEKILIDALMPKQSRYPAEPLFTEADRYVPQIVIDDYARESIRAFMEMFPDSRLEKQILAGKPVTHLGINLPVLPCATAKSARKNIQSLSDFFVAHQQETFLHYMGREVPLGVQVNSFFVWRGGGAQSVPRMELWEQWRDENGITVGDLFGMLILSCALTDKYPYLTQCARYIRDIYGDGFEQPINCRYAEHIQRIIYDLIYDHISDNQSQKIATALGIWICRCLPKEMLIGDSGVSAVSPAQKNNAEMTFYYTDDQVRINAEAQRQLNGPVGHFIVHPQIIGIFNSMDLSYREDLQYRIPVVLSIFERTFASTRSYMEDHGHTVKDRVSLLLNQIYPNSYRIKPPRQPDVSTFLYARHFGLISDQTLYFHLMQPNDLKNALKLITSVCAMKPAEGGTVSSKTFSMFNRARIRNEYERFVGKESEWNEDRMRLVELCRRTADKLVSTVVEAELLRGDTPTEYSSYVTGIHMLSGAETFVRILSALGKDSLDRSVYYFGHSQSKRGNLSYLLARCAPAADDDAEKLTKLLKGTDITEKRLIEAALYSPAWIERIGEYLDIPGFKSACYYFMAHMNERFDEEKKAVIARFTPLSEDELNLGAFDVAWFQAAYNQLGEKKFELIYDAAKYISDGSKHTRARKYADAALGRLTVEETEATVKDKRNKDLLMAYAIIPLQGEDDLIHRYLYLQQFLKESRQFGAQRSTTEKKAVETALRNLATNAGFSDTMRLTLRMETKLVEDSRELFDEKQVGEWSFRLLIDDLGTPEIQCMKDGKLLKSVPTKAKKDPYVVRLQEMKKQLTEQYRRTRKMFEQAMEDGAVFTVEEMRQLCENPVVSPIVSRLVFKSEDALGLFDGRNLTDLAGNILLDKSDTVLTVAHPLHLFRSGSWQSFQQYLYDHQIIQPFRQVFRELYVKTREELGCFTSLRYAGNQIQPKKAAACLKERRWVADIEAGLQKVYYRDNIVATIFALADWFTPADIENPTLEYVAFYDRKTGAALKIDDIPDVIFSEVMRDVDMAVSVAHAGGVDPEASHSTVEMRTAILSFTLPLLRLQNVKVDGSHAFIEGKLANYSVHLGSGVVHQLGGTMLNVLPVHSQHRGRFFLPFVDDDPKTAEIISKVILFAEDRKLKDPSILSQISH